MFELGIIEDELDGLDMVDVVVKICEGFGKCCIMSNLVIMMECVFGVKVVFEWNFGFVVCLNVCYIGFKGCVMLVEYVYKVVWWVM